MLKELRPAIVSMACFIVLTGFAYPLAVTGVAQLAFPRQANGSLIEKDGKVIGSALIGQSFIGDSYFHGRPSATTRPDPNDASKTVAAPYNAAASSASNAGPTARSLIERVQGDLDRRKSENPGASVPVDLVTTSASGLDPHITPAAAYFQVPRVARARGLTEAQVRDLVTRTVEPRVFGVLGEPRVNVLALNMTLDALAGR